MIEDRKRVAGPFLGVGLFTFPFDYQIFSKDDVAVKSAMSDDDIPVVLKAEIDYTVTMNEDQMATPGGSVRLVVPLIQDQRIVIVSNVAYTQEANLTNFTNFPPVVVNTALDRATILIQQLRDLTSRVLSVPETSSATADELLVRLLNAQKEAQSAADSAKDSAQEAKDVEDRLLGHEATLGQGLETLAEERKAELVGVGDAQAERLQAITDETLVGYGVGGHQETWTLTQDVASDGSIVLPNSMTYIRGRNHLRISWNGLTLYPSENFEEVGTVDQPSTIFKTLFQMKAGDVINAWTVPLGRGDLGNVETDVASLTSAVAELSRKAAFHNVGANK